jgi:hypothetical protein
MTDNVTELHSRKPANGDDRARPLTTGEMTDEWNLRLVRDWKIARAEQIIHWAKFNLATRH